MGILQARTLEWVSMPSSRGSSQPRDWTQVSHIVNSLLSEPPGKSKNTGVGSLSLLQGIFPTQGLNWDLLHCRQILYQLSYQGSSFLETTEWLHFCFSLSCIEEGNGNPLQCSCLENPRDRGAWWAAVYGITQSRTRLKRLSSSSSSKATELNWTFKSLNFE